MTDKEKLAEAKVLAEGQRKGAPNFYAVTLLDALTKVEAERDRLRNLLQRVDDELGIMDESEGIAGWHLNGDISPWDEGELPQLRDDINAALQEDRDD